MGDGMKRAEAAAEATQPATLTPSRRAVLREAARNSGGLWKPYASGDYRMARRLAMDGFGAWSETEKLFTINDAGRAAAKQREG